MTRYLIRIEATNVPEMLAGAPLSVEVISANGKAQRTMLPLASGPIEQGVDSAGSYLVRAALPSGRRISTMVAASDFTYSEDYAVATALLDLEEAGEALDFWREAGSLLQIAAAIRAGAKQEEPPPVWLVDAARDVVSRAWENFAGIIGDGIAKLRDRPSATATMQDGTKQIATRSKASPVRRRERGGSSAAAATLSYEWGTFLRWDVSETASIQKLLLLPGGTGTLGPLGEIAPPVSGDQPTQYLIKVFGQSDGSSTLVAWLPDSKQGSARLAVDPDNAAHRSGSVLIAIPDLEDTMTSTLFSYVRQGAFEEARGGLSALVESLQRAGESLAPNRGILAAYVLYKLRDRYADDLIPRLCEQYPKLADVHILSGAQAIAAGRNEKAEEPLATALRCGVPIYNEGVKLLRDSSSLLRDCSPDNAQLRENARKAGIIAIAANFDSTLTCLRLGRDLAAEFLSSEVAPASGAASGLSGEGQRARAF